MAEGEDPFGSLIKFCQPTSSQESKFESCSFARESETFPDYFDSLATSSPDPTLLEPIGVVIASLPESDSENNSSIHKSNTQENEDFLTPPEHHNPSASSSQEDPQRLKPLTPCHSKVSVSVVLETTAGDDEHAENEPSVSLRKGEKNLGFSETEKIDSCNEVLECWDSGKEVGEIEGFERELKRFRVFDSKLDATTSKKIRVLEENWDPEMHTVCIDGTGINDKMNYTEIIDLETEEIDEEINFNEGRITPGDDWEKNAKIRERGEASENVQKVSDATAESVEEAGKSEKCGSDGDSEKEKKGVDLDAGEKCLKVNGNSVLEESEERARDTSNNGKAVSGSSSVGKHREFSCQGPGNGVDRSVKERIVRGRHILLSSTRAKDMRGDESMRNTEEVEKSKNSGSCNDINQREKEQDVVCNGGYKSSKVNGTLALVESEKEIRHRSNNKVQRDGQAVLTSIGKIDKFRYVGLGNGVDHYAEERVPKVRRELPSSIRGKEKNMGGEENGGYVKVKNGSWKDVVDALEAVFGKVDDGLEEVDFLETAKKQGFTFPEPRWIDE